MLFVGSFLCVVLAGWMTTVMVLYIEPSEYQSSTLFEFNLIDRGEHPETVDYQREFEIVSARETLNLVVDKLGLDRRWDMTRLEASITLSAKLEVEPLAGYRLARVNAYHTESELAAQIAAAVADAYQNRAVARIRNANDVHLDILENQIAVQQLKLEKSRVRMLDVMEQYSIVDLSADESPATRGQQPDTGIGAILMQAKRQVFEAEVEIQNLRTTIATLQSLDGNSLIEAAADLGLKNPTLLTRYPEYQELLISRAEMLDSGVAEGDPKIVTIDARVKRTREMLESAVDAMKGALETQLKIGEKTAKNATLIEQKAAKESLSKRRRNIVYVEAKKNYDLNRSILADMERELAVGRMESTGSLQPITMHERAVASMTPARPEVQPRLDQALRRSVIAGLIAAAIVVWIHGGRQFRQVTARAENPNSSGEAENVH